ncbi:hypothetical protein FGG08_004708 [Glutinoglossum americanum]|uniref:Uncharacterized protein n=1 Tax=Glutinoglossum americanum TaxID=1670608 RepID=A0A9P8L3P7_9PEZI|nr:hypothetical protein FGG08_004708 [Glutinoglossum americanum]
MTLPLTKGLRLPRGPLHAPPDGFAPGSATDDELKKFIYPPRPNPTSAPKHYAVWQQIASCRPQFVSSTLSEAEITGLEEARNWSGAVLPSTPPDDRVPFDCIIGSWIIPNLHPRRNANRTYKTGDYQCYTWVGMDGWTNDDCVKIGVVLDLEVNVDDGGGTTQKRSACAAILFRGKAEDTMTVHIFKDFAVDPGDFVTGWVWVTEDDDAIVGNGWICNRSSNKWVSASVDAPDGVTFNGTSAEWIVAGKSPNVADAPLFPNYGATVFFNGLAHRKEDGTESMEGAMMVAAQDIKSSAVRDTNGVIVYSAALF